MHQDRHIRTTAAAIAVTIVSVLAHTPGAWGQMPEPGITGNTMLPRCREAAIGKVDSWAGGYCVGALVGMAFAAAGREICRPSGASPQQMAKVVVRFMEQHPERLHESFLALAATALFSAFPCSKGR